MMVRYYNLACAPSQNGGFFECLHPHQATFLCLSIVTLTGTKPVPLCEPSQKGSFFDLPQLHQWYSPGFMSIIYGFFCAMTGSPISCTSLEDVIANRVKYLAYYFVYS